MIGGRALAGVLGLLALAGLGACGPRSGAGGPGGVELSVTRGFGQERLAVTSRDRTSPGETALDLLRSEHRVETGPGDSVVSIDGLPRRARAGRQAWYPFVNGFAADAAMLDRRLAPGEVVQWDLRPQAPVGRVPATVGAYPDPLLSGSQGRRLPVRIECANDRGRACGEVERRLRAAGVIASLGLFGAAGGEALLRVIVAPWSLARRVPAAASLERGPEASGVFARFASGGARLELLDPTGRVSAVAPPGTGLVAASALGGAQPVWLVTGGDEAAVERAARALDRATLRDRYAVAVLPRRATPLPVTGRGPR